MSFLNFSLGSKKKSFKKSSCSSNMMMIDSKPLFLTHPYATIMLVKGDFKTIIELPKYVDINEWLAFNTFEFFNHLNLFYGSITDFCTPQSCPTMSAGPGTEYTWTDNMTNKKIKLSAPQYIDYMTSHIESMIEDERFFPTKSGREFPADFVQIVKNIFKQLFKLFAHIYHHHFDKIISLHEEPHFNSLFAHFISFARQFDLLEKKDIQPLNELIELHTQCNH
ncbi:Putative Maintenance-ploidy protein MOB1 (MPS1 binder 1) [Rhizopus microsporus]|nr:Putative Maintenance-ploidy protein MOB1 (MPS1 binder 1) [Rhizopus microsporus]